MSAAIAKLPFPMGLLLIQFTDVATSEVMSYEPLWNTDFFAKFWFAFPNDKLPNRQVNVNFSQWAAPILLRLVAALIFQLARLRYVDMAVDLQV